MASVAAVVAFAAAGSAPMASAATPFELTELAPGVVVHRGAIAEPDAGNAGDVANLGAVIGSRCVAVIDSGGSPAVGRALRAAIGARTTTPICYVINTHGHPDHILGNVAFRAANGPQFVGHARLAPAMGARGPHYLNAARRDIGTAGGEFELVVPTLAVGDRIELDLGDRRIELQAWSTAHTDQDLTVFDPATGTIFVGDLVFDDHLPVLDGNLKGWLAAHERLAALPVRLAVPGHGQPGELEPLLDRQRRYLVDLRDRVRAAIRRRAPLAATVELLGSSPGPSNEAGRWALVEAFQRRNVTAAYAELEWDD
jgi:quinoprotein relay system zinc metallohydrolase 2